MKSNLKKTFQFLTKTENEAATEVLAAALDCSHRPTQEAALEAILDRRSPAGHREVFKRLAQFGDEHRAIVSEHPGRLIRVVREAIKGADTASAAFDAILAFRLYDAMPAVIAAACDPRSPHFEIAKKTVLDLTEAFYNDLSEAGAGSKPAGMDSMRQRLTTALEQALDKFDQHESHEIVEAFLLLAKQQNVVLRRLLRQQEDAVHSALTHVLASSLRGGVLRVLLGFLEDPQSPKVVLDVIAGRKDLRFLDNFVNYSGRKPTKTVAETLARFEFFTWAEADNETLQQLDEKSQANAVWVMMASAMDRDDVFEVIEFLLLQGNAGGRAAAAEALADFRGSKATMLVVRTLNDEEPAVRAHLSRQLRPRNVPGAMSLLIRMVDHPHPLVRNALRESLPEFTFRQFMANFDSLSEDLLATTGHLVQKIDPECQSKLFGEMTCLSPVRRRRAIMAANSMGLIRDMEQAVIDLLGDDDHMVRIAAAKALAECETMPSWEALRDALLDKSVIVKEAAEASLRAISQALVQDLLEEEEEDAEQAKETVQ
jgi:hypothetical protein